MLENLKKIYLGNINKMLVIPLIIFILAISQLGYQYYSTGSFITKGASLSGGVSIEIYKQIDYSGLEEHLKQKFPALDISLRTLVGSGSTKVSIEADVKNDSEKEALLEAIMEKTGKLEKDLDYRSTMTGASLGESFFRGTISAVILAFLFMSLVVFYAFRTFVPSIAVIACAGADILMTIAVFNFLGLKLSTAGIAAFLMLIGYSVDTDILLTSRLLKQKSNHTVDEVIISSVKTGLTMTLTTVAAVVVSLFFTTSIDLRQLMTILFIGLIFDMLNTWITNVAILKWYANKKYGKN